MPYRGFRAGLCLALAPSLLRPWAGFSTVSRPGEKRLRQVWPRNAPTSVAAKAFKGFGEAPPKPKPKATAAPKGCRAVLVSGKDGSQWQVLIGKSAADNDRLSLEQGRADEVWMHAAHVPGSHVVVRAVSSQGRPPTDVISMLGWRRGGTVTGADQGCGGPRHNLREGEEAAWNSCGAGRAHARLEICQCIAQARRSYPRRKGMTREEKILIKKCGRKGAKGGYKGAQVEASSRTVAANSAQMADGWGNYAEPGRVPAVPTGPWIHRAGNQPPYREQEGAGVLHIPRR
eukprot:s251_g6.t1